MVNILIRYLGIKTKLLEPIRCAIENVTPKEGTILDLFAGSNTVGQYLLKDYCIISNDYQKYSYIAAITLIESHNKDVIDSLLPEIVYNQYYEENVISLKEIFCTPLMKEKELLSCIGDTYYGQSFDDFVSFFDNAPYYSGDTKNKHSSFNDCLSYFEEENIQRYKKDPYIFPHMLFTTYYGNPYFSLSQCVEIDSLVYSLRMLLRIKAISEEQYNIYLSFLVYSLNLTVISVGDHFAQPQKIKPISEKLDAPRDRVNLRERKKIIEKKRLTIKSLFIDKLYDYKKNYECGNPYNKSFCKDYKELLNSSVIEDYKVNTVYVDPPYTNAHYSRFYHIPETLVLYDYPDIEFFGRYRTDRFQSGFCIKSQAMKEFKTMISLCHQKNLNMVISYSDTSQCILSIEEIESMCKECYGNNIIFENAAYMYRNFGQKPNKVLAKEYIISCFIQMPGDKS